MQSPDPGSSDPGTSGPGSSGPATPPPTAPPTAPPASARRTDPPRRTSSLSRRRIGLVLGAALFAGMLWIGPPAGMERTAWQVAALTGLMALWWVTEALPIAATALLPVALLPVMGAASLHEAAAPYANPLIFLFLGGFLIAEAIQRWNLHQRIALVILGLAGQRPDRLVGGFMLAAAGLSMWVSNTATAALMLPIGLSVLRMVESDRDAPSDHSGTNSGHHTGAALMLGIAFGANIGGMATLIGSPPNALLAAFMADRWGLEVGFLDWMAVALPVALVLLVAAWWVLCRAAFRVPRQGVAGIGALIASRRAALGPMRQAEAGVAVVFVAVALAWVFRPALDAALPGIALSDPAIAMIGALVLFLLPAGGGSGRALLTWEDTARLPWGVLVLVGGGLSLGEAIGTSGLAADLSGAMAGLAAWPGWLLVVAVAAGAMTLSHVTSNTATAATLIPLASALAVTLDMAPLMLTLPVALAASCAFMLPVATPPNAIVFASGHLSVPEMARAGWRLSAVALVLIAAAVVGMGAWGLLPAGG